MILEGRDSYTSPSFSLRQRLTRQLWDITWMLMFRPTPRVMHAWRRTLLRAFGARLGELKARWPKLATVVLEPEAAVGYREVVRAMEVSREKIPGVMLGGN